jgi:hypothetical protein
VNTTYLLRLSEGEAAKIADEMLTFIRVKV